MSVVFANNAATTLAAAITSTSATTITVTSSSSFPSISGSEYFYATIDDGTNKEIVKVTGVSSETWTIVRAQDGTSARTFANGIDVELRNNAAMLSDIKSHFSLADNENLNIGAGNDLFFVHNGTNSFIQNATGDLYIENAANDKDIIFRSDDGSGGLTTYLNLDGSLADGTSVYVRLPDNGNLGFGANNDLRIYHDGSNTTINNFTGNLNIRNDADDGDVVLQSDDGSGGVGEYIRLDGSAAKTLFSKDARHSDSVKALFGGSDDLQIYHDASNSYIDDTGTGSLLIRGSEVVLGNDAKKGVRVIADGAVELRHNDSKMLETASYGVTVTGAIEADNHFVSITSGVGVGGTPADANSGEFGPGFLNLARDDTASAKQITFGKNGAVHSFLETTSSGLNLGGANVGINTASPARRFTVQGGSGDNLPARIIGGSSTTKSHIEFQDPSTTADYKVTLGSVGDNLTLQAGGAERVRIDSAGKVGIGQTSPSHKLDIVGGGLEITEEETTDAIALLDSSNSNTKYLSIQGDNGDCNINAPAGELVLQKGAAAKFTVGTNGVAVTGAATGTLTTDNDGSFDMAASNNFKCTPSGNFTLTFTNIVSQSGNILLVNSGGHTVSAHTNSKVDANLLATVSTAGTYLISYFSDGTNVYLTNSAIYT
jgi:hypothetical protein